MVTRKNKILKMEKVGEMERDLEFMREYYRSGKTKEASWRRSQLKKLQALLREQEAQIFTALDEDLGKHPGEAMRDEIGTLIKSLNFALGNLKEWMSGKKAKLPQIALLSSAEVVPEPLGLVLIISTWNFPFGMSLEPLIGAIAAGNIAVIKPSELAPSSSALLAKLIPAYLDTNAIKVIEGDSTVGENLLQQKWDKIFFTGSARVGRIVMSAAVKHLTPVSLELGGKCPAIVDSLSWSWDKEVAVNRILGTKFGSCSGQACIAVDYVIVEKGYVSTLVELMKDLIKKMFGENPIESNSVSRIINKHHFLRLKNLLADNRVNDSIIYGGSMDEKRLYIEPTILLDPPLDAEIMTEEIFGPLLPIISVKRIEDSIDFINLRPKPLAIYVFTKNEFFKKMIVSETSSGSVVLNDAIIQYVIDTLPFGGVGESGMGKYHGKYSFDTFSHYKGIVRRSFLVDFWFRFPPWDDNKLQLLGTSYNYAYFELVLLVLGLKKPKTRLSYV